MLSTDASSGLREAFLMMVLSQENFITEHTRAQSPNIYILESAEKLFYDFKEDVHAGSWGKEKALGCYGKKRDE